jgi:23S rRNA (guanosine2251-2'-O)-methyltransferase
MREWLTGRNPVYETIRAGRRNLYQLHIVQGAQEKGTLVEILKLAEERGLPVSYVKRNRMEQRFPDSQGIALETSGYPYSDLDSMFNRAENRSEPPFFLLLDTLQDPQNFGTLLRTAEAVGVHGVCLPHRRTVQVTPAVVNASSGASEHLLVAQLNLAAAIQRLKELNVWVIGLDHGLDAREPNQVRLDGSIALVVESEESGMRRLVREACDLRMRLPMQGKIESLNAAVAGSVALYLAYRTRW